MTGNISCALAPPASSSTRTPEKRVWDFEPDSHIIPKINMVVRGCMGAQLHAEEENRRTSKDAGVLTPLPKGLGGVLLFQLSETLLVTLCSAYLREHAHDADLDGHASRLYASVVEYNRLAREGGALAPADPATLGRLDALRETLEGRPPCLSGPVAPAGRGVRGRPRRPGRLAPARTV